MVFMLRDGMGGIHSRLSDWQTAAGFRYGRLHNLCANCCCAFRRFCLACPKKGRSLCDIRQSPKHRHNISPKSGAKAPQPLSPVNTWMAVIFSQRLHAAAKTKFYEIFILLFDNSQKLW